MTDRTALYLAWQANDSLLYIGTSRDPKRRWRQHAKEKPWWPQVEYVDYRWFDRQWQAELAEQFLISRECPPHNRIMPPWRAPMPNTDADAWCGGYNELAGLVFDALESGADLEAVAKAADWSPRYIVRLGRQRHRRWAMSYTGPHDDMPEVGYLYGKVTAPGAATDG